MALSRPRAAARARRHPRLGPPLPELAVTAPEDAARSCAASAAIGPAELRGCRRACAGSSLCASSASG
eukprot:2078842-Pyramimonas_sp.AAC.1